MRGIAPADIAEPQAAGVRRKGVTVDRIVLEHHQGVEQIAQSGQALDLGKPEMLVRDQAATGSSCTSVARSQQTTLPAAA